MNNYYSYSKLSTYLNCPQKYKLSYLDKIKKKEESIEAFIGKVIHEVLEWLYNNSKEELSYLTNREEKIIRLRFGIKENMIKFF